MRPTDLPIPLPHLRRSSAKYLVPTCLMLLVGCTPPPTETTAHHHPPHPDKKTTVGTIPAPILQSPMLDKPDPTIHKGFYTIDVTEMSVGELLRALAKGADLDTAIDPRVTGKVTIAAKEQTLSRIMEQIAQQLDIRYEIEDDTLVVQPGLPIARSYHVDHAGGNAADPFWPTLSKQLCALLGIETADEASGMGCIDDRDQARTAGKDHDGPGKEDATLVQVDAKKGQINVRATPHQHEEIQSFLDQAKVNAKRQVQIEVMVVQVRLNPHHQEGIPWHKGVPLLQTARHHQVRGAAPGQVTTAILNAQATRQRYYFQHLIQALRTFGAVEILPPRQLATLNNRTAVLEVADQAASFRDPSPLTSATTDTSAANDLRLDVTPQIDASGAISLLIGPAHTDPETPDQAVASLLRLHSGQVAMISGLMNTSAALASPPAAGKPLPRREVAADNRQWVVFLRPSMAQEEKPLIQANAAPFFNGETSLQAVRGDGSP